MTERFLIPDENLPSIIPADMPEPIYTDEASNLSVTRKADIQLFNNHLKLLYLMYGNIRTVKSALELHDRVMEMIKRRRDILGLEYGAPQNKASRATVFEPVD